MAAYPMTGSYNFVPTPAPLTADGFVQDFDVSDEAGIRHFFDTYGFVVVRDAVSRQACEDTIDEVWGSLAVRGVDRHDSETWESWPWGSKVGMLGSEPMVLPSMCRNRESPVIHRLFAMLHGDDDLRVNIDRAGVMRPTKNIRRGGELCEDVPEFRVIPEWVHLDMNPWTFRSTTSFYQSRCMEPDAPTQPIEDFGEPYHTLRTQGILNLLDHAEQDGGFHCVPGFHKFIRDWAVANEHLRVKNTMPNVYDESTVQIPKDDPVRNAVQRIPMRAGSFLVFNSALPHGAFPNQSERFRMVQYIRMVPRADPAFQPALIASQSVFKVRASDLPPAYEPSELGRRLLELDDALAFEREEAQREQARGEAAGPEGAQPVERFRMVQYIRMVPRADPAFQPALIASQGMCKMRASDLPRSYEPTELGRRLLELDDALAFEREEAHAASGGRMRRSAEGDGRGGGWAERAPRHAASKNWTRRSRREGGGSYRGDAVKPLSEAIPGPHELAEERRSPPASGKGDLHGGATGRGGGKGRTHLADLQRDGTARGSFHANPK
eukprot:CAMPEP_0198443448 /NCGR_PEP_ID=MMETSP1452-20131203/70101_1 /TAXON_ID=1181717 /ORGANISM="Synchroma pusillum, Strain CCMP3072" /LENGTH=551 /DNA_ID=CAMNT_0044164085 /DNA_START=55 /DNA_END=1710 /DNA_ORIENTATION=-